MIVLKSPEEIELMAKAASVTAAMLEEIPNVLMPGMTTLELDHWCEDYILRYSTPWVLSSRRPEFQMESHRPASQVLSP